MSINWFTGNDIYEAWYTHYPTVFPLILLFDSTDRVISHRDRYRRDIRRPDNSFDREQTARYIALDRQLTVTDNPK